MRGCVRGQGLDFSRINSLIVRAAEDHYSCLLAVLAQLSENKKYYTTFITVETSRPLI